MDSVKSFAVLLVFLSAAGFIYYFLLPAGKVSQTAKSVLSAVLLLVTLSPLFSFMGQELPSFSVPAEDELTDGSADVWLTAAKETLKREIGIIVKEYTDLTFTLELDAHIAPDGTIHIERVKLCFPAAPAEPDALREALGAALGTAPLLEYREDG